jgi:prophage antirepressor-like protein
MSTTILTFENIEFDIVDIHNVPWLRGHQVVDALGYKNPRQSLDALYSRNADEFTDEMTQILDLPTAGGIQPVRIFSPRGCYLLGMLARTERAKAFRQWVLDVLEGRALPQQARPTTVSQQIALHRKLPPQKACARHCTSSSTTHRACWPSPAQRWTQWAARFNSKSCPASDDITHRATFQFRTYLPCTPIPSEFVPTASPSTLTTTSTSC